MIDNPRRKIVIDTNVILFDASAIKKFLDTDIYVPICVIEEIDKFKRDPGENGRNARQFSRFIDELRAQGSLAYGVKLKATNSCLFVNAGFASQSDYLILNKADNQILADAIGLSKANPNNSVELITKDINLRIKADIFGIIAKDYEPDKVNLEEMYSGHVETIVEPHLIESFYQNQFLNIDVDPVFASLKANQYVIIRDITNNNHSAIGRMDQRSGAIVPLISPVSNIWGISPRNVEQAFAMDSLLNDDVSFVSLVGKAGTGKTLLAIAAGLYKTLDENRFHKLLVSRPIFPMGRDIGYLPGDIEDKLNPWMQPIFDNIEFLMGSDSRASGRTQELMNQGVLNIEPLTYIRGRSIPNQYLIVDEAQNLTPHEIKTIVTRAGEGTKIVLTGDPYQIDNPYIDSSTSGLMYSVERFKGQCISAHVTLSKGERSELAELASNIL